MAEKSKQPTEVAENKSQNNKSKAAENKESVNKKATRKGRTFSTLLAIVAIIVALIAGSATAFIWQQAQQEKIETAKSFAQMQSTINENQKLLQTRNQQLATIQEGLTAQQKQFKQMSGDLQTLLDKTTRTRADWKLLEINYLLRQADLTLRFNRDVPGAIAILQNANAQIKRLRNSSLLDIRTSLASDILQLKALPKLDLADLLMRLNAVKNQIPALHLRSLLTVPTKETKSEDNTSSSNQTVVTQKNDVSRWRKAWDQTLNLLKEMVIIRHHEKPIAPLMTPEQQTYLVENLTLMLEQAQWAAIHTQQDPYNFSLQQATNLIKKYYRLEDQRTKTVLDELTELGKIHITRKLPDISATQTLLQKHIAKRFNKTAVKPTKKDKQRAGV